VRVPVERRVDRRIFVVGVPRSGTTLVQSLLAAHSALTSFTESHFFDRHFSRPPLLPTPVLTRDPSPRLRAFLAENDEPPPAAGTGLDREGRPLPEARVLLPLRTRAVARRLLRILDELTVRRGVGGWIEKTPRHLRYVPFLERISVPEAPTYFVHVIRDGLEVVASLREASKSWERPYDLDACAGRWNADLAFSLGRVGAPRDHFVFYEDLTSQPLETLRGLLEKLGLDWEPEVVEHHSSGSGRLVTGDETWKAGLDRSIVPSRTSHRALAPEERERALGRLRTGLYGRIRERISR
jgi:hypothetical protein